jgi:N-acetylneuraminate synthase/N,N'-diacetyllegionaminate synthase
MDWLASEGFAPEIVVMVQATSPLVRPADLAAAFRLHLESGAPVTTVSAAPHAAWSYRLVERRLVPLSDAADAPRRQDAASVVTLNGAAYVAGADHWRHESRFVVAGRTLGYEMPVSRSVDVDAADDLVLCDALLAAEPAALLSVGGRAIGQGAPCYVIAEGGVNHNGDLDLAHRLVDAAADAGADAVKFQTFDPDRLAAADAPKAEYQQRAVGAVDQRAMLRGLMLAPEAHRELQAHATERGIAFLSSPFDEVAADFLHELGLPAFKIPSGEVTNHAFLAHVARFGRPLLLSTGMCDMIEVAAAVDVIRAAGDPPLALFHCVSNYPAAPATSNLRAIRSLALGFGVPAGWSDHTPGIDISLAAIALGACLVEKHLTLSRAMPGPDHAASLEPADFTALVRGIRDVESALGDGVKQPVASEAAIAAVARKSLHWKRDARSGETVSAADLVALRPGTGLPPSRAASVVGRRLSRDVAAGRPVALEELEA